ncbi:MAG: hypothetical protein GMKNLPBB_00291 [Myxococcota bacterium]|nr:hypothetical protein [Myxococcota bacterium]
MRIHHLALGSPDPERLAIFYRQAFGLKELATHRHSGGAIRSIWLDLDGIVLMIESSETIRPYVHGPDSGWFLTAFAIRPEEREVFEQRLAALDCPVEGRTDWTSYFRDPDGNRIAVSYYPVGARRNPA